MADAGNNRAEVHGDWQVVCAERGDGERYCTASQVQVEREGGARILAIELMESDGGVVRGALALPFGLALQAGVRLSVDEGGWLGDTRAFSTCLPDGCVVPLHFGGDAAGRLRTGGTLGIHAVAVADRQAMQFQISLKGLTAALRATQ